MSPIEKVQEVVAVVGAGVLLVFLSGCSSKELTRSKAAELIQQSEKFNEPLEYTLNIGEEMTPNAVYYDTYCTLYTVPYIPWDCKLRDIGLVELSPVLGSSVMISRRLTDRGRVESKGWSRPRQPWSGVGHITERWSIPLARRAFVEITGIPAQTGFAQVEFKFKWTPTEIARSVAPPESPWRSERLRRGLARFQLYDDGWRIVELTDVREANDF